MTERIRTLFESLDIEPVSPAGVVWDLSQPGCLGSMVGARSTLTPEIRREVLGAIVSSSLPVFICGGELASDMSAMGCEAVSPGIWRLDPALEAGSILELEGVEYGNWALIAAERPPPARVPDLIRATEAEVIRFMRENAVHALVDSFHDDTAWRVAVAPFDGGLATG